MNYNDHMPLKLPAWYFIVSTYELSEIDNFYIPFYHC